MEKLVAFLKSMPMFRCLNLRTRVLRLNRLSPLQNNLPRVSHHVSQIYGSARFLPLRITLRKQIGSRWAAELRKTITEWQQIIPANHSMRKSRSLRVTDQSDGRGQEKKVWWRGASRRAAELQCVTRASEAAVNQGCSPSSRLV